MATITANSGSYSIIGASSILAFAIAASTTSYALTGSDITTRHGYQVVNPPGVYTLTGSAIQSRRVSGEPGSYQVQGQVATLRYGVPAWSLVVDSGSYAETGGTTKVEHAVPSDRGSYGLTGTDASLLTSNQRVINVNVGSYTITPTLTHLIAVTEILTGDYNITGTAATVRKGRGLVTLTGSYTIAPGPTVKLAQSRHFPSAVGSYTLTGSVVNLAHNTSAAKFILAGVNPYQLLGQSVTLRLNRAVIPVSGSYTLTGTAILAAIRLPLEGGTYEIKAPIPPFLTPTVLLWTHDFIAGIGGYSLTGQPTNLILSNHTQNPRLVVDFGIYNLFGFTIIPKRYYLFPANSSTYGLVGQPVSLLTGHVIPIASGSYNISGIATTLRLNLPVATTSYNITGQAVTLPRTYVLGATNGSYALLGTPNTLLLVPSSAKIIVNDIGTYAIIGVSLSSTNAFKVDSASGSYSTTGSPVTLRYSHLIAESGQYQITGSMTTIRATHFGRWQSHPKRPPVWSPQPKKSITYSDVPPSAGVT